MIYIYSVGGVREREGGGREGEERESTIKVEMKPGF